ncbi:hypothetical protein ACVWZB_004823 [Paenibacillus polymyxa]
MKVNLNEYLVDQVEKKILAPKNFNKINLKRLDTNMIYSMKIYEPTLNNTLVCIFSKAFGGPQDGVIVWDWSYELSYIEELLSGKVLRLDQFDVENLQTTVGINIEVWLD